MLNRTILATSMFLLALGVCCLQATSITILERQGPAGSMVNVPVKINGAQGVAGGEFLLEYDQTLLEFLGVDVSPFSNGFSIASDIKENRIAISMARSSGLMEAKGTLFYLKFRIRRSAQIGTVTEFTWRRITLYSEDLSEIACDSEHGILKVSEIIVFPNPFTPNKDGFNDYANFVVPDSILSEVHVKIFNITGNKVREISQVQGSQLSWDGLSDEGDPSPPGVYLYILEVRSESLIKGTITLMR